MKNFENWLDKSHYEFTVRYTSFGKDYYIKGSNDWCRTHISFLKDDCSIVYDSNDYHRPCKNIEDTIELVEFLVEGIC